MLRFFVEAQGVFRESGELSIEDQLKALGLPDDGENAVCYGVDGPAAGNHMTHAKEWTCCALSSRQEA
jgi:hypothetical protein